MSKATTNLETESGVVKDRGWSGQSRGGRTGNGFFVAVLRLLGMRIAYICLVPVALYFVIFLGRARRATRDYRIKIEYGGKSTVSQWWAGFQHFFCFGQILLDRIAAFSPDRYQFKLDIDGVEHIQKAIDDGKGLILLSSHCGNWETAGHLLCKDLQVPISLVFFENEIENIRKLFDDVKSERAFSIISSDGSAESSVAMMSALRRGEIVAMLVDRDTGANCETVDFLGEPAKFPAGPYALSAISGAPVINVFAMRKGMLEYEVKINPANHYIFKQRNQRREVIRSGAQRFAGELEEVLRRYPLQWHNFYDFWNTKKAGEQ